MLRYEKILRIGYISSSSPSVFSLFPFFSSRCESTISIAQANLDFSFNTYGELPSNHHNYHYILYLGVFNTEMSLSTTTITPAIMFLMTTIYHHISVVLLSTTIFVTSTEATVVVLGVIMTHVKDLRLFSLPQSKPRVHGALTPPKLLKGLRNRRNSAQSSTPPTTPDANGTHGPTQPTASITNATRASVACSQRPSGHRKHANLLLPPINELPGGGYQCAVM